MLLRPGIRGRRAGGFRETAQESIQPVALTFTASFGGKEQFALTRTPIYGMELVCRAGLGPALKHFSLISQSNPPASGFFNKPTEAVRGFVDTIGKNQR